MKVTREIDPALPPWRAAMQRIFPPGVRAAATTSRMVSIGSARVHPGRSFIENELDWM